MKVVPSFPNGLVYQTADDIRVREFLISQISEKLQTSFRQLNRAIAFQRIETPCLVPKSIVQDHIDDNFELYQVADGLYLRPESTKGTFLMFSEVFPQESHLRKNLPFCLWQSGLSFRVEQDKTFANLRFKQFYQLEFQIAYAEGTMADYHRCAINSMCEILKSLFPHRQIDVKVERPPFYSRKTTDIYLHNREVVAISNRTDFRYPILEVSCGLDRLVAIYQNDID